MEEIRHLPVEGQVVEIPLFTKNYTSQVVVWDFWTINSMLFVPKTNGYCRWFGQFFGEDW